MEAGTWGLGGERGLNASGTVTDVIFGLCRNLNLFSAASAWVQTSRYVAKRH